MSNQVLEQRADSANGNRRPSILIVDDDESMAEVLNLRLSQQGFETATAGCGQSALELARSKTPQLIILDLGLPDMDGLDLCQTLVDDPETGAIPVIIVSGREQPDIIRRSRAAGCQYFVRKPYDPNALLILIQKAIEDAD